MTGPALRFESYRTATGSESMIAFGPAEAPQVVLVESILEERNFLRRTAVGIARILAEKGIGCVIPDLPGTGESLLSIEQVRLVAWRAAVADATAQVAARSGRTPVVAALRAGAILDDAVTAAAGWWRYAPASGMDLLRPMRRAEKLAGGDGETLAGYRLDPALVADLEQAAPIVPAGACQIAQPGFSGTPLWRRAEPAEEPQLTAELAEDLLSCVASCAAA